MMTDPGSISFAVAGIGRLARPSSEASTAGIYHSAD